MLGGGPTRNTIAAEAFPSLAAPRWVRTVDAAALPITFIANACPASNGEIVLATGRVRPAGSPTDSHRLFAFDAASGTPLWHAAVATPVTDSMSSPVIDSLHHTAIHASGAAVAAYALADGALQWQRSLSRPIVNASPVITADRTGRNRLFITDYDGFGQLASLYCINLDGFDAALNPFLPGAIVWSVPIGGASGNSPTYLPAAQGGTDRIYVASVGDFGFDGGVVFAFDITTGTQIWARPCPTSDGFFGGVTIAPDPLGTLSLYASTYAFAGGPTSATLVKLQAASGELVWSTPCNRAQTVPVVLADGSVFLSGGVSGFGSVPSLERFQDSGASVTRLWHTALSTWADSNTNGVIDPGEYLRIGGWLQQPIVCNTAAGTRALLGVLPSSGSLFGPSPQLLELDLDQSPLAPGFSIQSALGVGGSASFAGGLAFSIGTGGLQCFGSPTPNPDVDNNHWLTIDDLVSWDAGLGRRDVDRNGTVDTDDRAALLSALRAHERADVTVAP